MKRPRPLERHEQQSYGPSYGCLPLALWLLSLVAVPCSSFVPHMPTTFVDPCLLETVSCSRSSLSVARKGSLETSSSFIALLEALTVKELRDRVKEISSEERGVLSRLKRKQDLIDYLVEMDQATMKETAKFSANVNGESRDNTSLASRPAKTSRSPPTKLPPLSLESTNPATKTAKANPSPKDIILQDVFRRYPPVREATEALLQQQQQLSKATAYSHDDATTDDTSTISSHDDIRQLYHPLLQACRNISSSSDMDIVFVGTASCTPGVTRGVSCTALRLNWKRRAAQLYNLETGRLEQPSSSSQQQQGFQGGTWLFDVGECTQV
jgi:hypothetical protein